jgi:hypothetical protein
MKVEVEIPEGKYCEGCLFNGVNTDENAYCYYLHVELYMIKYYDPDYRKHIKCPAYPHKKRAK